jgi:hypothetical protein
MSPDAMALAPLFTYMVKACVLGFVLCMPLVWMRGR